MLSEILSSLKALQMLTSKGNFDEQNFHKQKLFHEKSCKRFDWFASFLL